MKQNVLTPAGDEQVVKAVVIVIAHRDAGRPGAAAEAGLSRDVLECAVAVVAIKPDRRLRGGRPGAAAAGQHHDVQPAIVVVIHKRRAASHGFQNVIGSALVAVDHRRMQARRVSHIHKFCVEWQPRWLTTR